MYSDKEINEEILSKKECTYTKKLSVKKEVLLELLFILPNKELRSSITLKVSIKSKFLQL